MTRWILLMVLFCSGCSWVSNSTAYEAYWHETYFKLTLKKDFTFDYLYEGHLGNSEFNGTYYIVNDTVILNESTQKLKQLRFLQYGTECLVELETRFDYCKRESEVWGSKRVAINYPQLAAKNTVEKDEAIDLLNIALSNPELDEYFSLSNRPLIVQEYYQINSQSNRELIYKGESVVVLTEEAIRDNQISEYLIIKEVTIGIETAMIIFQVMPEMYIGIVDTFKKKDGEWKLNKRWD